MGEIVAVESLAIEQEALAGYEQFLGNLALKETVAVDSKVNVIDLIQGAAEGDVNAYGALETNVSTTVIETILKHGNITRIHASYDEEHGLTQFGHRYHDIQANTLQYQQLGSRQLEVRTHVEGINWQRIEVAIREGLLKDNWLVVASPVADDVPLATAKKAGFFTDTMTTVLQATTETDDGIVTESAFVAGIDEEGERYDLETLRKLYASWGVKNAGNMTSTDMLGQAMLIPKTMMPHGVANVAEAYDNQLGPEYFFGKCRPRQDYASFQQFCMERETRYHDVAQAVVSDLITHRHKFGGDVMSAQQSIYDLVKRHTVNRAMIDDDIDAAVFGIEAEVYIETGRMAREAGDWYRFAQMEQAAEDTAETTACGGGSKSGNQELTGLANGKVDDKKSGKSEQSSIPKVITCIIKKCRAKSPRSQVVKSDCWRCPRCRYEIDICTGKVRRKSMYDTGETEIESAEKSQNQSAESEHDNKISTEITQAQPVMA